MKGWTRGRMLANGATVALAVVADQIVKYLVEASIPLGGRVPVLPFFDLYHTQNFGVAFSMLDGAAWLAWLSVAVIGFMIWLWVQSDPDDRFAQFGFSLILGGAIGNLADRVLAGHVTDYALFHAGNWSFAVFNLADTFITIGAGLILISEFMSWRRQKAARKTNGE